MGLMRLPRGLRRRLARHATKRVRAWELRTGDALYLNAPGRVRVETSRPHPAHPASRLLVLRRSDGRTHALTVEPCAVYRRWIV